MVEFSAIANREVRRIPKGWQHPRDEKGRFLPLHRADYFDGLSETEREEIAGSYRGLAKYAEHSFLMPLVEGQAEIAAYETTTEGTPISPAFADTPEGRLALVNYCAANATTFGDNRADAETWAAILFGGEVALVGDDGSVKFS